MSGYARAHRSRWDHPLFKKKSEAAVWAWMCDMARFREHTFQTRFGMVTLARGQILISERGIAEDFNLHKNTVRRLISTMSAANMISLDRDHAASRAGTIVTLLNYEKYQSDAGMKSEPQDQGGTKDGTITGPKWDHNETTREEREEREERLLKRDSPSDSSIGKPTASVSLFPVVDDIGRAFAAYQLLRSQYVANARPLYLSPARRKTLGLRLREIDGLRGWDDVLARIRGSPFLRGETERFAFATIDWLLKPANLLKVREGNFDERRPAAPGKQAAFRGSPIDALGVAIAASGLGKP
jgi:hypothetical protein